MTNTASNPEPDPSEETRRGNGRRWKAVAGVVAVCALATGAVAAWTLSGGSSREAGELETRTLRAASDVSDAEPPAVRSVDAVDLTGTWAHRSVQISLADIPLAGEIEAKTETLRVTEIRQDGTNVTLRTRVCDTRIESAFDRVRTEIPDSFIETAPVTRRRGTLETKEGRLRLLVPEVCSVRGAKVDDPVDAPLPTDPSDDRVRDGDDDGHPGVTIRVEGMISGEMYMIQRGCDSYSGTVHSGDRIRGRVDWRTEQNVLEATSMWLSRRTDPRPHPEARRHTFTMRRVDDDTKCADLLARREGR